MTSLWLWCFLITPVYEKQLGWDHQNVCHIPSFRFSAASSSSTSSALLRGGVGGGGGAAWPWLLPLALADDVLVASPGAPVSMSSTQLYLPRGRACSCVLASSPRPCVHGSTRDSVLGCGVCISESALHRHQSVGPFDWTTMCLTAMRLPAMNQPPTQSTQPHTSSRASTNSSPMSANSSHSDFSLSPPFLARRCADQSLSSLPRSLTIWSNV